jgi:endonuclease III
MEGALSALATFYGPIPTPPHDAFAYFVWDVISGRSVPARRDHAWHLLKRLPALTPDAMFGAPKKELKAVVETLGHTDDRLDALRDGSGYFRRHRELAALEGTSLARFVRAFRDVPHLTPAARLAAPLLVGRHPVPALDDGVARVLGRLHGVPAAATPRLVRRAARRQLASALGRDVERLTRAVVILGHHARHACADRSPHCSVCPLRDECCYHASSPRS